MICAFCVPDHVYLWLWRRRCSKGRLSPCILIQTNINPSFLVLGIFVLWCPLWLFNMFKMLHVRWTLKSHLRESWLPLFAFLLQFLLYEHLSSSWGKGWQTNILTPASKDHTLGFLRVIAVNNLLQGVQICFPALLKQQPKNSNQLMIMPVRIISNRRTAILNKSQIVYFFPHS